MFRGIEGQRALLRMKPGRCVNGHGINAGREHLPETVETAEAFIRGHAEFLTEGIHAVGKIVRGRGKLIAAVLLEDIRDKSAASAAAT